LSRGGDAKDAEIVMTHDVVVKVVEIRTYGVVSYWPPSSLGKVCDRDSSVDDDDDDDVRGCCGRLRTTVASDVFRSLRAALCPLVQSTGKQLRFLI